MSRKPMNQVMRSFSAILCLLWSSGIMQSSADGFPGTAIYEREVNKETEFLLVAEIGDAPVESNKWQPFKVSDAVSPYVSFVQGSHVVKVWFEEDPTLNHIMFHRVLDKESDAKFYNYSTADPLSYEDYEAIILNKIWKKESLTDEGMMNKMKMQLKEKDEKIKELTVKVNQPKGLRGVLAKVFRSMFGKSTILHKLYDMLFGKSVSNKSSMIAKLDKKLAVFFRRIVGVDKIGISG